MKAKLGEFAIGLSFMLAANIQAAPKFQRVNMNSASREQIMVLAGVGDKLAQRIVAHRDSKGYFSSLDDLLLVQGMKPKLLKSLAPQVEFSRVKNSVEPKKRSEDDIKQLLVAFEQEPKVAELQAVAIKYATAEPTLVEEWLKRSRLAPALPSLAFSLGRGVDYDASIRERVGEKSTLTRKDGSDFDFSARLEWKLSELVFNRNELYVARESFRMSVLRERILEDVNEAYFERRKAQLKLIADDSFDSAIDRVALKLRVEELSAILDGLTGGWFNDALSKL